MLFYTHLILGIVIFLLTKDYFSGGNEIIFFLLLLLGSVFPDIDDGKSKMKKASGIIGSVISFFFKHRGIFHSLLFALVSLGLISFFWKSYYGWAFFMGYLIHLLSDALTPHGITFFYPFSNFKLRGPIRVGSIGETIILIGLILLIVKELVF